MKKQIFTVKMLTQADKFFQSLPKEVQKKVLYNIGLVTSGEYDRTIFKKLEGHEIWELRTRYNGLAYRFFTFYDKYTGNLIVATHGIIKKSQKTPLKEIKKAEKIMKQYYLETYPDKK